MVKILGTMSIYIIVFCSMAGCHRGLTSDLPIAEMTITLLEPEAGATLPANLDRLHISWQAPAAAADSSWSVVMQAPHGRREMLVTGFNTSISGDTLRALAPEGPLEIKVCTSNTDTESCSRPVTIIQSNARLEGTLTYRTVEPLFNPLQTTSIVQLEPDGGREVFAEDKVCIGCHARSSQGMYAVNMRRGKDRRLAIFAEDASGQPRLTLQRKIGEFSYLSWSPDGRYLAMVVNTFGIIDLKNDVGEPFGLAYKSGDLAILDLADGTIKPLPGASELDYIEDMPSWSQDGQELVFVRYRMEVDGTIRHSDLYTIPFNAGQGGQAVAVSGASANNLHNYFPNFSADGRWISFVRGDGSKGVFARKSSDIFLLPRTGGTAKRLELNRDGEMDSWHRWSPDGKWLIFAAKRHQNMTALYASRIDPDGNAAPPVRLAGYRDIKINIPEFASRPFSRSDYDQVVGEAVDLIYSP